MRDLLDILAAFDALCRDSKRAALATVIAVSGSSYRPPGARMLIAEDGRSWGGVSGGCLERDVITRARGVIDSGLATVCKYDTVDDEQLSTGVATGCGGMVQVLIQPISSQQPGPIPFFQRVLSERIALRLATVTRNRDRSEIGRVMPAALGTPSLIHSTASESFVETLRPPQRLVIFGAGPDIVPLLEIARTLGWCVAIVGTHPATHQAARFGSNADFFATTATAPTAGVPIHAEDAVLVMTHNLARDRLILQSLDLQPRYLGVLGPRHRLEQMIGDLPAAVRETIVSPIGLDLGAETPQEIALAIVAEIQATLRRASAERLSDKAGPIHDRPVADRPLRTFRAISCPI